MSINKFVMLRASNSGICLLAAVFFFIVAFTTPAQTPPATTQPPTKTSASQTMPMMAMPIVAPLFIEDNKRASVITMVNDAPNSVVVDVSLLGADGSVMAKQTQTIDAHSTKTAAVADVLATAGIQWPASGSVLIQPHRASTMAAQLSISGRNDPAIGDMEEEFSMMMDEKPSNFRTVANSSMPLIAIRSLSTSTESITVSCLGKRQAASTKTLPISPKGLLVLRACNGTLPITSLLAEISKPNDDDAQRGPVAIALTSSANASNISVFGLATSGDDERVRLTAVPFTDANNLVSSTAIYPGAFFSVTSSYSGPQFRLRALAANFDQQQHIATVSMISGGSEKAMQTLVLGPGQILATASLSLPVGADASLKITSDGNPGMVMTSVEATSSQSSSAPSICMPAKDQGMQFGGGQHPWRIDAGFHSTLMLSNPDASTSSTAVVNVRAAGQLWKRTYSVPPGETVSVSIDELIAKQVEDGQGTKLPKNATNGLVTWLTTGHKKVFGMLLQNNPTIGYVRPYACAEYYALCSVAFPNFGMTVYGAPEDPYPQFNTCGTQGDCDCVETCLPGDALGMGYYWYTADQRIARLPYGPYVGLFQGVGVGSTYAGVEATDEMGCSASGGGEATVRQISYLQVIGDRTGDVTGCPAGDSGGKIRQIDYAVRNNDNTLNSTSTTVRESFDNSPTNTCTGRTDGISNEICGDGDQVAEILSDHISTQCSSISNPSYCGFTHKNQQWWVCPTASLPFAKIGDLVVTKGQISVNGNSTAFQPYTSFDWTGEHDPQE